MDALSVTHIYDVPIMVMDTTSRKMGMLLQLPFTAPLLLFVLYRIVPNLITNLIANRPALHNQMSGSWVSAGTLTHSHHFHGDHLHLKNVILTSQSILPPIPYKANHLELNGYLIPGLTFLGVFSFKG